MTDPSFDELKERRDELASIKDDELDRIRERLKGDFIQILRAGIDEIGRLPGEGRPDLESRRRAEIAWFAAMLASMESPQ